METTCERAAPILSSLLGGSLEAPTQPTSSSSLPGSDMPRSGGGSPDDK